jgi:predicted transposase YdaD
VILTDTDTTYRPDTFIQAGWDFEHKLHFPLVKIIDYKNKEKELENSPNPMAIVVLAQLKCLESKKETPEVKFDVKLTLIRMLYRKGYNRKQIEQLLCFIDWLITLPKDLEEKITDEIIKFEEVEKMTYVTSFERVGEKRKTIEIVKKMLENGDKVEYIMKITDLTREEILDIKKEMDK